MVEDGRVAVDGQVTVKCSNYCGFSVTGAEEFCASLYENHEHQDEPGTRESEHWYEHVFSFWSFLIVMVVVGGLVSIITHTPFDSLF